MPEDGPAILKNISALGFNQNDIRHIIISHSHIDHLGSTKFLAGATGAKVCIGEADVEAAERGSTWKMGLVGFLPFKVDIALREGDIIAVKDRKIHIFHTPGHTPGCISLGFEVRDEGRRYNGFIFGGPGVNVFQPGNLKKGIYGGTLQDFKNTLARLDTLPIEVWLGAHPNQNNTFQKLELLSKKAKPNPYIDPEGWKSFLQTIREKVKKLL
jgi:metallo-beta-lactamase class B